VSIGNNLFYCFKLPENEREKKPSPKGSCTKAPACLFATCPKCGDDGAFCGAGCVVHYRNAEGGLASLRKRKLRLDCQPCNDELLHYDTIANFYLVETFTASVSCFKHLCCCKRLIPKVGFLTFCRCHIEGTAAPTKHCNRMGGEGCVNDIFKKDYYDCEFRHVSRN